MLGHVEKPNRLNFRAACLVIFHFYEGKIVIKYNIEKNKLHIYCAAV
jgi:hypothetical protein